ncbi:MAG TPA: tRNA (adenosine(37)-N6)-dimethylallyltransferase MiaA [Gaiellales bacterium]|nr:tRNA (adenosine(37)-N6)-dimethylallyltransferase MiaA [Gaiellales bacterium]
MPVIAIFGPTASGKSGVAIELAELAGGEIISADAMQLYRGLPILTNQPSAADLERVPHHLIGIWEPSHEGSVAEFAGLAHEVIDDVLRRGRVPILCGGSGLYVRAALADMPLPPQAEARARRAAEELYDQRGPAGAHATLAAVDAPAAAAVHPNDRRRVVRALELAESGHSLAAADDLLWSAETRHPTIVAGLALPPNETARRIAERTAAMFAAGVEEEVQKARTAYAFSITAERIHGLQDVSALLAGEIDREEAIRRLEARTRHYAKRQRTWMRRLPDVRIFDATRDPRTVAGDIAGWA